jgi:hypothetical protein
MIDRLFLLFYNRPDRRDDGLGAGGQAENRRPDAGPGMEVTQIILLKIYRFCQLSSRSRGFFVRVWIFKSIGPLAHGFRWRTRQTSYDTNMLPKVFFDKTCLSNLKLVITSNKTLMKQIQSNQKSLGKSIPAYVDFKNLKKKKFANQKSRDFCPNLCDFQ